MAEIAFSDLVLLYENTEFEASGERGTLSIRTAEVLRVVKLVDEDDAAGSAGVAILGNVERLVVGQTVSIVCGAPRPSIGLLAPSLDALLKWPPAAIAEPADYYVVDGRYGPGTVPVPDDLAAYRAVLALVGLLGEAAAFLDPVRRELMFLKDGRVPVPVRYDEAAVRELALADAGALQAVFSDDAHKDQKLAILADAVVGLVAPQPADERFRFILRNLSTVLRQVRDGYRLFASEFSYEKIRSDIEDARLDYLNKIHKTVTDIQGQLLGLPVATVVVASQLKVVSVCGADLWTDVAVLSGAWIFVVLLLIAIGNQRLTLSAIAAEVTRQKTKMEREYAAISARFIDVFDALAKRIRWHGFGLVAVCMIAFIGAGFATFAFFELLNVDPWSCAFGSVTTHVPTSGASTSGGVAHQAPPAPAATLSPAASPPPVAPAIKPLHTQPVP